MKFLVFSILLAVAAALPPAFRQYTNENGFQPPGDHLPTPPPMPEHVVELLADLRAPSYRSTPEEKGAVSRGSYSYTSHEGTVITVNWVAREGGFQATGDLLPTPPPMPEEI